jgi:large subunit ribosomal protein L1
VAASRLACAAGQSVTIPCSFNGFVRYLRAVEVGKRPGNVFYEVAIRIYDPRPHSQPVNGTVLLPHPLPSKTKTAVICPENSEVAKQALAAGAFVVGEESIFATIRDGKINFERLLVHDLSELKFNRERLGPILGPLGLMPSRKRGTVTANIKKELASQAKIFREETGVVRIPIGTMAYTPKMLATNLSTLVDDIKGIAEKQANKLGTKRIMEVVFSSVHGPGFSLNGLYLPSDRAVSDEDLTGPM